MISLLLLIPIIGSILLLPIKENSNQLKMKQIALTTSLINFFISLFMWYQFDSNITQYQFVTEFNHLNLYHLNFGVDSISLYFVLLTTFVTPVALLSNYTNISNNLKTFLISFLILESLQICAFVSLDLLLFYIFFESVLPVLFIVIVIFGHGPDKYRSALLFFLYTLAGSLPMLLSILTIYSYIGSTDFQLLSLYEINIDYQKVLWLGFFLGFAVKTPLYPFIIWLPKAHADSVLAGSILLAATILKLATYGYLRVLINFLPDATHYFSPLVQTICIITIIYSSFSTIVQQDTKRLIAYSSIAHMGVVVLGLFSNTIQGIEGAILLSIAHGFVSPALFICVGGIIYDRTHTRVIHYIRGLVTYMPVFTILFFVFTLANTGIPLTLNFLGEQMSLLGIFERNPITAILGATSIVTSACYSLFLYNRISYGTYSTYLEVLKDINRREFFLLLALLIPTIILGIFPNVILDTLHMSVTSLLYEVGSSTDLLLTNSCLILVTKPNLLNSIKKIKIYLPYYYNINRNMSSSSNSDKNINKMKDDIQLSETDRKNLEEGLDKLKEFSEKEKEKEIIENLLSSDSTNTVSSFNEAFPNYEKYNSNGVFDKLQKISESTVLKDISAERGLVDVLDNNFVSGSEELEKKANSVLESNFKSIEITEDISEDERTKLLGEFGEMTINELLDKGFKIIRPLKEQLEHIGMDPSTCANVLTFLFMYRTICSSHARILSKFDPYKKHYDKLSLRQQMKLQEAWIRNVKKFNFIAAPLLVTSLYIIKQMVVSKNVNISFETNKEDSNTNIKNSINFLVLFKKLPDYIGKIILTIISIALIKYLLEINSINLMDPFYIKIFCILGIMVISIFTLDYLLKYFISTLFKNYGNLNISNNFPKLLYEYLSNLKILVEMENSYNRIFLFYFVVYFTILLLLTSILIIL